MRPRRERRISMCTLSPRWRCTRCGGLLGCGGLPGCGSSEFIALPEAISTLLSYTQPLWVLSPWAPCPQSTAPALPIRVLRPFASLSTASWPCCEMLALGRYQGRQQRCGLLGVRTAAEVWMVKPFPLPRCLMTMLGPASAPTRLDHRGGSRYLSSIFGPIINHPLSFLSLYVTSLYFTTLSSDS